MLLIVCHIQWWMMSCVQRIIDRRKMVKLRTACFKKNKIKVVFKICKFSLWFYWIVIKIWQKKKQIKYSKHINEIPITQTTKKRYKNNIKTIIYPSSILLAILEAEWRWDWRIQDTMGRCRWLGGLAVLFCELANKTPSYVTPFSSIETTSCWSPVLASPRNR